MEDREVGAPPELTSETDTPYAGLPSRLVRASSWAPRPIPTLVEGLLHRQGLAQFSSKPGVGKSPVAADLAVAVATADPNGGTDWAGLRVNRRGPVVYVALESAETVQGYLAEASAQRTGHPDQGRQDVWVLEEPELLLSEPDGSLASLDRVGHDVAAAGIEPVLYVFDTQVDLLGGVDDYKGTAVTPLIDKLRRWCVERDALGLVLHHTTHTVDRGSGSINIMGKVDVAGVLTKDQHEVVTLSVSKRKGLGRPLTVATCTFETGPVVGTAQVRWVKTGADAADLPVAGEVTGDAERERLTAEWLVRLMPKVGETYVDGHGKERDKVWSNQDAVRSMQALAERPADEGGPVRVHVNKRYVGPILDQLASDGQIVDLVQQWKTGMGHKWQADPKQNGVVTPSGSEESV